MYPIPKGDREFQKEIEPFKARKGTLKFPLGKDLQIDLIKKIVRFRILENPKTQ